MGFSTKIHWKTDHCGGPIAFRLTGGEASDRSQSGLSLDLAPEGDPRAVVADKGYDCDADRALAKSRGATAVIRWRKHRRDLQHRFAKKLYRGRARIAQTIGKLKRFKRVALRCEKTKRNDAAVLAAVLAFLLVKSVDTA